MPSVSRRYQPVSQQFERSSGLHDDAERAPVVLMVSGGADSTALLVLAATSTLDIEDGRGEAHIARERLHVLHVNHQLRGIDAQEDEEFVRQLSARFGIPCTVKRVDVAGRAAEGAARRSRGSAVSNTITSNVTAARTAGDSAAAAATNGATNVENVGREVRYAAAAELANQLSQEFGTPRSAARILTAHTANDRAETFFMNAIRGTGPAGLSSIPRRRNRIVRPLLNRTHAELCELLRMRGIVWREDATNNDTRYLRAFVRHEVMPVVEHRNPRVLANLSTTCDILSDEDTYLTSVAGRTLRELTRRRSDTLIAIDARKLAACEVAIARRVVRQALIMVCPAARLEARHIEAVLKLVARGSGSAALPLDVDARVEYGMLFLRARTNEKQLIEGWLAVPGAVELERDRTLRATLTAVARGINPVPVARTHGSEWEGQSVLLDAESCGIDPLHGGRLWVDAPQVGDILCPLGMHGQSKKLSDLLNEAKIPAADRAQVPVVRSGPTGQILWVAGVRADERARVRATTDTYLELRIENG